jgi:hypothetical protein
LVASPRPCSPGCGVAVGTPRRGRFARGASSGHAQIARARRMGALAISGLFRLAAGPPGLGRLAAGGWTCGTVAVAVTWACLFFVFVFVLCLEWLGLCLWTPLATLFFVVVIAI